MDSNPHSCDKDRIEALECLNYVDGGRESVLVKQKYFAKVDDRSKCDNYSALLRETTKRCKKIANPQLWVPLNAHVKLDKLIEELGFDWPSKADENFQKVEFMFNEIDEDFKKKGLKPVTAMPHPKPSERRQSQDSSNIQSRSSIKAADEEYNPILDDERLKNIDKKIAERILNEVVHKGQETKWDDIAGLENVKQAINEIVVYPMQNPELFQGLLAPAKGLLLFGPPGTGKTLIGRCIASESGATFFAISASSLTSKWIGEGEKMVRALFAVARCMQPSVIFIDEIDSLLTQRVDGEHDSSRRMKTEFLVQFDGVATGADDRLLVVGATNRPQELDEAARRRFTKRLYVPLPDPLARRQIINTLMSKGKSSLSEECIDHIVDRSDGFSGADMSTLCKEAALCSVRAVIKARGGAKNLGKDDVPSITRADFDTALRFVKASVGSTDLDHYVEWDIKYGATRECQHTQVC